MSEYIIKKINRGNYFWCAFVFFVLIFLDQVTKYFAFHTNFFATLNLFWPLVGKQNFLNSNFAFSLPLPGWLMYLIYFCVFSLMLVYVVNHFKIFSSKQFVAWTFVFAGAISNIGERILFGSVRDFIYIYHGIFNVADFYIFFGIMLLLIKNKH